MWLNFREAKAWREPGRSDFQCVFLPYQPAKLYSLWKETYQKSSTHKQKASKLQNGNFEFSVIARVEGASGVEGSAKAWFAGGFKMLDSLPSQVGPYIQFLFWSHRLLCGGIEWQFSLNFSLVNWNWSFNFQFLTFSAHPYVKSQGVGVYSRWLRNSRYTLFSCALLIVVKIFVLRDLRLFVATICSSDKLFAGLFFNYCPLCRYCSANNIRKTRGL